jgi:hypothetical protein
VEKALVFVVALAVCAAACGAAEVKSYRCPKVADPPTIDGRLDDAAWKLAPPVRLVLSETGSPAAKKTIARMCWDDSCLYVSFDCEDEDIWGTYTQRDDPVYNEEVVEVFASPACDLKHYFELNVSPRNVVFDSHVFDPVAGHPSAPTTSLWNCEGLRTAVCVDGTLDCRTDTDKRWSAELAIPFAGLGTSTPKPGQRWRLNLYRIDLSPKPVEFQAWSPTLVTPAAFHIPERFGTVFFEGLTSCGLAD